MTSKRLYKISAALAAIPSVVGLLIFLIWWAFRAFFAIDAYNVENAGVHWLLISLLLTLASLITLLIWIFRNLNSRWMLRSFWVVLLLGLSYPTLKIVVKTTGKIQQYAFVRITNGTQQDLKINFYTYLKKELFLKPKKSKVISYIPKHEMKNEREYNIEPLVFNTNQRIIELNGIDNNQCRRYILNKNFQIIQE